MRELWVDGIDSGRGPKKNALTPHKNGNDARGSMVFGVMKIGLYGGTFDPIHHGHVILAREVREQLELDRVIFLPNIVSPHKLDRIPTAPEIRLEMVRAAVADEPGLEVDDLELRREPPSFTIDTVRHYHSAFPKAELFYFIGADNLAALRTWKEIDSLKAMVRFVVFSREVLDDASGFPVITRRVDISSTEVRTRVASGRSIRYLVPERVREIIAREKLYRNP